MELSRAQGLAERIVAELQPFCERIEIAGSIRRRRRFVNDIDLVALPKRHQVNALRERVRRNTTLISDGDQALMVRMRDGTQLDLWIASREKRDLFGTTPTNFGSLLLCRTGSKEHNIWLVEQAKRRGLRWNPHHGVFGPWGWPEVKESAHTVLLASATEEEIFTALGLEFIEPERRERP